LVDISDLVLVGRHFGEEYEEAMAAPPVAKWMRKTAPPVSKRRREAMVHDVGGEAATIWLESSEFSLNGEMVVSVDVKVKNAKELQGFQWNLNFDPSCSFAMVRRGFSQLEVLEVTEGNFLKRNCETIYWRAPDIDPLNGRIKHCAATRLTEQGISGEGVLATILFRVENSDSELFKNLRLTDVKLANTKGSVKVLVDEPTLANP